MPLLEELAQICVAILIRSTDRTQLKMTENSITVED